jgi:hypothetical protein
MLKRIFYLFLHIYQVFVKIIAIPAVEMLVLETEFTLPKHDRFVKKHIYLLKSVQFFMINNLKEIIVIVKQATLSFRYDFVWQLKN